MPMKKNVNSLFFAFSHKSLEKKCALCYNRYITKKEGEWLCFT